MEFSFDIFSSFGLSFAIACRLYSDYREEKSVDTMDYEEQYYEYDLVPTHDFDDYWMDDNKFNALPWEDKRFDFFFFLQVLVSEAGKLRYLGTISLELWLK